MPVQLNWVSGAISAVFEEHFRLLNLHVEQLSQTPLQNGVHTSCEPSANELCKRHLLKTCVYDFLNSIHHTLAAHCAPKQSTISTTCSMAFAGEGGVALWHSTHRKVNYPHLAIIWASLRHLTPAQIVPIMMSVCVGMGTLRQRFGDCSIETPNKLS